MQKLSEKEIKALTNQLHDLANEVSMHGWDYRPLLRANELLEAFAMEHEPKYWIAQLSTNWGYDDQGRRVEWNTFTLHPKPMPQDYIAQKHEVIIMASSLGSALDKALNLYCPNGDEIRISATGYIFEE